MLASLLSIAFSSETFTAISTRSGAASDVHTGHVALRILAVGTGFFLISERQRAEEYQPFVVIVLPKAARRPLASGLFDDGEEIALHVDVTEKWFELLVCGSPAALAAQPDHPATIASRRRFGL